MAPRPDQQMLDPRAGILRSCHKESFNELFTASSTNAAARLHLRSSGGGVTHCARRPAPTVTAGRRGERCSSAVGQLLVVRSVRATTASGPCSFGGNACCEVDSDPGLVSFCSQRIWPLNRWPPFSDDAFFAQPSSSLRV